MFRLGLSRSEIEIEIEGTEPHLVFRILLAVSSIGQRSPAFMGILHRGINDLMY